MKAKITICLLLGCVFLSCSLLVYRYSVRNVSVSSAVAVSEIAATPVPTPIAVPTPSPTPTPSPIPTPTQIPFSFYAPTVKMNYYELVGDNGNYDLPVGYPTPDTYRVVIDLCHQVVMVYQKDGSGNYTVPVRYMLCSTGEGNKKTPTGVFSLKRYRVRFGFFQSDRTYGQYWTLINGRIYFHSILYSERNAASCIEETYRLLGTPASHGCIRLTVPDARFIYYNLSHGTEIEIREGSPDDSETAAIRASLVLPDIPKEPREPFPEIVPENDNWTIGSIPNEIPYEEGSQKKQL